VCVFVQNRAKLKSFGRYFSGLGEVLIKKQKKP
jgi:hypothetical protein